MNYPLGHNKSLYSSTDREKGYQVIILYLSMGCDNLGSFTSSFSTSIVALFWWKLAAEHKIVNYRRESNSYIPRGRNSLLIQNLVSHLMVNA